MRLGVDGLIIVERITDDWARKGCLHMIFKGRRVAGDFKVKRMSMVMGDKLGGQRCQLRVKIQRS